jgi:hypothetical protein
VSRELRDISASGAFLLTEDGWLPGTLLYVVLQSHDVGGGVASEKHFGVWAKVVRRDPQGLGLQFLFADKSQQLALQQFIASIVSESGRLAEGVAVCPLSESSDSFSPA